MKWELLYKRDYVYNYIQIRVNYQDTYLNTPRPPYPIRVKMSILNRKREKTFTRDEILYDDFTYSPFLRLANKNQEFIKSNSVQIDGSLIIYCEIHTLMKKETLSGIVTNVQHPPCDGCSNQLIDHLEEVFEKRMFTDITMSNR